MKNCKQSHVGLLPTFICRKSFFIKSGALPAALFLALAAGTGAVAADFPQGLMLHFSFDDTGSGGVMADQSGRGNIGNAVGAKWTPNGKQGGGCEFASTSGYVRVANAPSLNLKHATFALWFKTSTSNSIERCIFDKQKNHGYALGIAGAASDANSKGKLRFEVNGRDCLSDRVVTDGVWHHGAATFDGESMKLYVDGQPQKQAVSWQGKIATNELDLTIGMNRSSPSPQEKNQSFDGVMDDVMIFDHALSATEIQTVMAFVKPKFTKGQVAQRLIQLKDLLDRGLILQDFYDRKVKECESGQ